MASAPASTGSAGAGAGTAATGVPTTGGAAQNTSNPGASLFGNPNSSDYLSSLSSALFSQNSMVTSQNNDIGSTIASAISGLQGSQAETNKGIQGNYGVAIQQAQVAGQNQQTAELEARRGMATNTGILQNIQYTTNQNVNDLQEKMDQAISTGDAATAQSIAGLQVQALQLRQTATEQAFTNMTNIASTMNSAQQTQIQQQAQNLSEQQAVANIGLQFGIPVKPGMSLSDMVSAAAPKASQKEMADLAQTVAQTNAANAQAAQAEAGVNALITPENAGAFSGSYLQNLLSLNPTAAANASSLVKVVQQQGGAAISLFQQQTSQMVGQQYDPTMLNQTFTQALKGATPGTYTQIVNQLRSQYGSQTSGLGQMATPTQLQDANNAITTASNNYLEAINPAIKYSTGSVANYFSQIFGGAPVQVGPGL